MNLIRKAEAGDAHVLIDLYHRHLTTFPPEGDPDVEKWQGLLERFSQNPLYHLLVLEADGVVVASVTLVIVENLTHGVRPYGVIENVVTHGSHRGKGYATALMNHASQIAQDFDCYKVSLCTGSKRETTLRFYRNCGFSDGDKTAFLKRL